MCDIIQDIINNYKMDNFSITDNQEYRMISEKTKYEQEKTKQEEEIIEFHKQLNFIKKYFLEQYYFIK